MPEESKVKDNIKTYFEYGVMLVVVALLLFGFWIFAEKQDETLREIKNELSLIKQNKFNNMDNLAKVLKEKDLTSVEKDVLKVSEQVNIPLEVLKEVKYFNQMLNEKQQDTLQFIVYILAFFSIIATFFGYKTITNIKNSADREAEKLSNQYKSAYDLLKEQAELSKNFYDLQYKRLEEDYKKMGESFSEMYDKYKEIKNTIEKKNEETDQEFTDTTESYKKKREEAKSFFREEVQWLKMI